MSETPIIGNGEQNIGAGVPFLGPKADSRKDKQNKKNFHGASFLQNEQGQAKSENE